MTRTTPELVPTLQPSTPHQREDVWPLRMQLSTPHQREGRGHYACNLPRHQREDVGHYARNFHATPAGGRLPLRMQLSTPHQREDVWPLRMQPSMPNQRRTWYWPLSICNLPRHTSGRSLATTYATFHATPAGGRLATTYDLACNKPHTWRILSGIGFRTCDLTTGPPRPIILYSHNKVRSKMGLKFVSANYHQSTNIEK
ncbi:hypothetical protein AVEN_19488-1 [Araneus ventricosus]|uniref:Uncharacterized protein n=1 Tax=Araneus ventricosus TaxID=182803 RepID=A0A4Y2UQ50_ARAVE|nr:hypothetical protein AVEN_19488-1 [Araneus ventricosus]